MITRVKGTQDILDVTLRQFFLETIRAHVTKYNFIEIITPILEKTELFQRAVGTQTDIISKEMYFVTTQHDDEHICLRPEITASVIRAFLNNTIQTTPWKVYSYGPVFRHERPQKGRYREFYQVTLEIIGSHSPAGDVYFITMLDRLFHEEFKLDTYALTLNFLGCHEDRERYKQVLDVFVTEHETLLCNFCKERKKHNILRVLDCKTPTCQSIYQKAPVITDHLCQECAREWQLIKSLLHELAVSYTHTPHLVRGLDYYSKIVFEFVAQQTLGTQNAFCAGGRYDTLACQIGSKIDYPSIGAALGVERILLLLEPSYEKLALKKVPPLTVIIPLTNDQNALALHVADELHAHAIRSDIFLEEASIKSKLRKADDKQAARCIFIGPDEQNGKYVTVKNMKTGTEKQIPQTNLVAFLTQNNAHS